MRRGAALWRRCEPIVAPWFGVVATAATIALIMRQLRGQDALSLVGAIPADPAFWLVCVAVVLTEPVCDWIALRRLERIGREAVVPLVRKQTLNDLFFGYVGDAYFLIWLRRRLGDPRRAFTIVCDLSVVSSLMNTIVTLALLVAMWAPLSAITSGYVGVRGGVGLLGIVLVPVAVLAWNRVRARSASGLVTIMLLQSLRTVAVGAGIALAWHLALPAVSLSAWMLLSAGRMIVSRIPVIPNKDLAFVACAGLFAGQRPEVVPMIASVTFLLLALQACFAIITFVGPLPRRR